MSNFNYDGSGNISFQIQTISSIINYKYPSTYNLSTISGFIFKFYQPTLSGFILPSQYFYTISSSFPQYNFPVNNWNNDQFSNRFVSTFIRGFLSISGNIIFQNNGSINNCQNFNGLPTSFFNQLLTISSSLYNLPNYQNQINSLSSTIYNIKNNIPYLDSYTNVFTGINTFINNSVYFGINQYNSINGESDNFQIKGYKQIQLYLSSLNLSIASITNTGITINTGNLQIGTNSLTSSMISYLSNDVQNQFNTLSALIYQKPSGLSLLSSNNVWSGVNSFNKSFYMNNYPIYLHADNYHYVGGVSVNDGPMLIGYGGCSIGLRDNLNQLSVNTNGIQINTGNITLNSVVLTSSMISYLSNVSSDIQNQISSLFLDTLSFNSSSVTYTNSQIGNNQFIIYNGFSDSTLTLPSCNSLRSGQVINVSNTQNVQTIANGNFSYPLISSSYLYVSSLPSWTIIGYSVIVQQSSSPFFPTGILPSGPNYNQSIAIQTGSNTTSISQNVYLNTGVSTLSFYAGPRQSPNYTVSNYFNVTIGSTTVISNTTFTVNQNWTLYTVNYSAPNVGNYNLVITSSGGSGDSSINFANITIVTPNNNRILTINSTNYQPNLNGFNNGEFLSTSNISLQKNDSVMLINDGKNYTISKPSTLLSTANTWSALNNFMGSLQVGGTNILTTITNSVNALLSTANTWTATQTFNNIYCKNSVSRSPMIYINSQSKIYEYQLGVNQYVILQNNATNLSYGVILFVIPSECNGQSIRIWNKSVFNILINCTGSGIFTNKGNGTNGYTLNSGLSIMIQSDGGNEWGVFNS